MKRSVATVAVTLALGLGACDGRSEAAPDADLVADAASSPVSAEAPMAAPAAVAAAAPPSGDAQPASDDAPIFAALYPGAQIDGPAAQATGPAGAGGMITFTTEAAPDAVVAFYRERAEAAGLAPVNSMNQGAARAYSAASRKADGPMLEVVAAPGEGGLTSVQLSWSAGA